MEEEIYNLCLRSGTIYVLYLIYPFFVFKEQDLIWLLVSRERTRYFYYFGKKNWCIKSFLELFLGMYISFKKSTKLVSRKIKFKSVWPYLLYLFSSPQKLNFFWGLTVTYSGFDLDSFFSHFRFTSQKCVEKCFSKNKCKKLIIEFIKRF